MRPARVEVVELLGAGANLHREVLVGNQAVHRATAHNTSAARLRAAGRLPVVTFAAGGLATPADVGLLMELGVDGVFVGSGIFKGENPAQRARALVAACTHYRDPATVARVSSGLGKAMVGLLEHESGPEVAAKLALKGRIGVDPGVAA